MSCPPAPGFVSRSCTYMYMHVHIASVLHWVVVRLTRDSSKISVHSDALNVSVADSCFLGLYIYTVMRGNSGNDGDVS